MGIDEQIEKYNKLASVLEEINELEMDDLIGDMAKLIGFSESPNTDSHVPGLTPPNRERIAAKFSALILKTALGISLTESGRSEYHEELLESIKAAVESAATLVYCYSADPDLLGNIIDIVSMLCECKDTVIENYAKEAYPKVRPKRKGFSNELEDLIVIIGSYCFENDFRSESRNLLIRSYDLLVSRVFDHRKHDFAETVFASLCEDPSDEVLKMFQRAERYYNGHKDKHSYAFYNFYGACLETRNEWVSACQIYEKCYSLAVRNFGEDSWQAAVSTREKYICKLAIHKRLEIEELSYLLKLTEKCLSGAYADTDTEIKEILAAKTIRVLIANEFDHHYSGFDVEKYLPILECLYEKYDGAYGIQLYDAKRCRARYLLIKGDLIAAEAVLSEIARETGSDSEDMMREVFGIRLELLLSYALQYDFESGYKLFDELEQELFSEERNGVYTLREEYTLYVISILMYTRLPQPLELETADLYKDLISEAVEDLFTEEEDTHHFFGRCAIFISTSINKLVTDGFILPSEYNDCLEILKRIEKSDYFAKENYGVRLNIYSTASLLDKSSEASYLDKMLEILSDNPSSPEDRMNIYQVAALHYFQTGDHKKSVSFSEKCRKEIRGLIHNSIKYLDDSRLINVLSTVFRPIINCYSVTRDVFDIQQQYEQVLNFKSAASLAIKERNRYLHSGNIDNEFILKIKSLQDRIAVAENSELIFDKEYDSAPLKEELRRAELEYATKTNNVQYLKYYTAEEIQKAIPEKSVLVEYYFWQDVTGKESEYIVPKYDIYICRFDGLHRITLAEGEGISEAAERYVEILQMESNNKAGSDEIEEKGELRKRLNRQLISPILEYIVGADTVYLSPDLSLINLPFELLYDNDISERLDNNHIIIKLECGRDLVSSPPDEASANGSLVIGDPSYLIDGSNESEDGSRSISDGYMIARLEFSGAEAKRIAEIVCSQYNIGNDAKASLLKSAQGYENIHIATHGIFDENEYIPAEFSAYLLFAGAQNYINGENETEDFGNGIITADELSRLDLHGTKLAVISACFSGMNELTANKGFYGMIGAMSAAGIKYVISHLWKADDLATAILMTEFYKAYVNESMEPPSALRYAKKRLRQITMRELREDGWIDVVDSSGVREDYKKFMEYNDRARPFMSESYWGGFACYKCN